MTGFEEIFCHGPAHEAEPDESNCVLHGRQYSGLAGLLRTSKAPIPSYPLSVRTKGRFARLGVGLLATIAGLALVYMLAVYLGGALLRGVVWAIVLVPRAFIWVVLALQEGADGWAIAGRVAATVGDALSTTQLALSVIALELVGAAALYVLQRLTRDEARPTRSKEAKP